MISNISNSLVKYYNSSAFHDSLEKWVNSSIGERYVDYGEIVLWFTLFLLLLGLFVLCLSRRRSSRVIETVSNNLLVISLIVWVLGVVVYIVGYWHANLGWLSVLPRAIISSFRMFVVANELARVSTKLHKDEIYMAVFALVHFAAAAITFLFIFKMVGHKVQSSLKILINNDFYAKGKDVHLFWGVNEASCTLAEDIRANFGKDATIIFVDIDKESDDSTQRKTTISYITNIMTLKSSDIARLDDIDALVDHCYNGPASLKSDGNIDVFGRLHLRTIGSIVRKSRKSYFYFLSNDEAENMVGALNLQKDVGLCSLNENRPTIYIHARRDANNEIFDHYSQYDGQSNRLKIKIIDSAYLSIASLKDKAGALPVDCVQVDTSTGLVDSPFTALIVGFGSTGQEAFKFLYEYAAFVGRDHLKSPFRCYAIDEKMNKIAGLVRDKMPAIGENELTLIQTAVDSDEFWTKIKAVINDLNYVVVALNDDATGLSFAVNLFKFALRNRPTNSPKLKIMIRCYDSGNQKRMTEVMNSLNSSSVGFNIEIQLFGLQDDIYSCDTLLLERTLAKAKEFNKLYNNSGLSAAEQWEKDFGKAEIDNLMNDSNMSRYHAIYDINRRIAQNISNAQHCRTKMALMGLSCAESSDRLEAFYEITRHRDPETIRYAHAKDKLELLLNIARVEHERWIASHKLMGYTYNKPSDHVKKYHESISSWDTLSEKTKSYDCSVVDTTIKLMYNELKICCGDEA